MYSQTQPDFTRNLECMWFTSFYFHSFTKKSSCIAMASAHHKPLTWFPFLGNGFGEFCMCVEVAVSHGNNAFFCHMMKWSHLVQLPVPTKPFQGPCSAPLKAFDLQIRHWESLAQFRKRNWPLTFSLTSYVSHERNHTQKACFAKILRGPYWYKQSWWGANSPTSSFCILATRHVSWQTGVDCLFLLNQKPGHAFLYKPKF